MSSDIVTVKYERSKVLRYKRLNLTLFLFYAVLALFCLFMVFRAPSVVFWTIMTVVSTALSFQVFCKYKYWKRVSK